MSDLKNRKHIGASIDLKNRKRIGTSIDLEVWDSFEELAVKTKIPKSKLFDEALKDIVKKYEPK